MDKCLLLSDRIAQQVPDHLHPCLCHFQMVIQRHLASPNSRLDVWEAPQCQCTQQLVGQQVEHLMDRGLPHQALIIQLVALPGRDVLQMVMTCIQRLGYGHGLHPTLMLLVAARTMAMS